MKLSEILSNFKQPIPRQLIKQKTLKGNTIDFVPWFDMCELLDSMTDGWEWEIKSLQQTGESLTLVGRLTIYGEDGQLTREATGTESLNCSGYGDPSSNAEAMALRRCCAKFGLGRDLWRKPPQPQPQPQQHHQRPRSTYTRPQGYQVVADNRF